MPDKHTDEQFSGEKLSAVALMKLPMAVRRRIMADQAEKLVAHYEELVKDGAFDCCDYIEYDAAPMNRDPELI